MCSEFSANIVFATLVFYESSGLLYSHLRAILTINRKDYFEILAFGVFGFYIFSPLQQHFWPNIEKEQLQNGTEGGGVECVRSLHCIGNAIRVLVGMEARQTTTGRDQIRFVSFLFEESPQTFFTRYLKNQCVESAARFERVSLK